MFLAALFAALQMQAFFAFLLVSESIASSLAKMRDSCSFAKTLASFKELNFKPYLQNLLEMAFSPPTPLFCCVHLFACSFNSDLQLLAQEIMQRSCFQNGNCCPLGKNRGKGSGWDRWEPGAPTEGKWYFCFFLLERGEETGGMETNQEEEEEEKREGKEEEGRW